jgi:hypothetical protein
METTTMNKHFGFGITGLDQTSEAGATTYELLIYDMKTEKIS